MFFPTLFIGFTPLWPVGSLIVVHFGYFHNIRVHPAPGDPLNLYGFDQASSPRSNHARVHRRR